jgi:flavin-binding protein dodecin
MSDHVYAVTEIVGSSASSIDDAIRNGIKTASQTLRNLEWFEVGQIRGMIKDSDVGFFQVSLKLGFRYDKSGA